MYGSLYCATAVVLGLEPPQDTPDYSTDPDTWDRYVGTYNVLDYEVQDPAGIEFESVISKVDDELKLTFPTIPDPFNPTVPFSRTLTQALLDTFVFGANLDDRPDLDVTFIEDPMASGEVKWMRTRFFVGTRATMPQGTNSLTARVFVDYRCDGFFQEGLDVPLRDASVRLSFPNGAWITRQVRPFGLVNFSGFDTSDGITVTVNLPGHYKGYVLGHCPGRPGNIRLQADDFQFGFKSLQFGAGVIGEAAGP